MESGNPKSLLFALCRIGLSRTFLKLGQEYKWLNCTTELGQDRKGKLVSNWCHCPKGKVCFQYKYDKIVKSPSVLLELAVKAGAVAFVATEAFPLPENVIHPIPIYVLSGERHNDNHDIIRLDVHGVDFRNGPRPKASPMLWFRTWNFVA